MLELRNSQLSLWVEPDYGACTLGLSWRGRAMMPDRREALRPTSSLITQRGELPEAGFNMLPWSGRVFEGKMWHEWGQLFLGRAEEHALHGEVWDKAWQVESHREEYLRCRIERPFESRFPADYSAIYEVQLVENKASFSLTITNNSPLSIFMGGGFHPYFSRLSGVMISFDALAEYPATEHVGIPSGPALPSLWSKNFAQGVRLSQDVLVDASFLLGKKSAQLIWPQDGVEAFLEFSDSIDHLVVYNPDKPWFAVEPVSHSNNILGEVQKPLRTILKPGGILKLEYSISFFERGPAS